MRIAAVALPGPLALAAAILMTACGGGGGDAGTGGPAAGGPAVTSASIDATRYGQNALVTVNGSALDSDLTVASAGCKNMTRSTTAPNVSTATTVYYNCTVSGIGPQSVAITRSSTGAALGSAAFNVPAPQVTMTVSDGATVNGSLIITLAPDKTPITVDNFLAYVNSGFYNGTVFHRVVKGFVIQGGGYLPNLTQKTAGLLAPITLEVGKGLSNVQWSIAMARLADPNSATSQFFVNTVDNSGILDPIGTSAGYAVFGNVSANTALVTAIENVPCTQLDPTKTDFCVPNTAVVITSATQTR